MTCQKCSFEFCWHCKQDFTGHSDSLCKLNWGLKIFYLVLMLLHILGVFDLGGEIKWALELAVEVVYWDLIAYNSMVLIPFFSLLALTGNLGYRYKNYKRFFGGMGLFLSSGVFYLLYKHGYLFDFF